MCGYHSTNQIMLRGDDNLEHVLYSTTDVAPLLRQPPANMWREKARVKPMNMFQARRHREHNIYLVLIYLIIYIKKNIYRISYFVFGITNDSGMNL